MGVTGALGFLLVCGALTLGLSALLLRGLGRAWAESRRLDALARREGWRHLGSASFVGPGGENDWRGGPQQDSDNGDAWTEFRGGVPGLRHGGFLILPRAVGRPAPGAEAAPDSWRARLGAALDQRLGIDAPDPRDDPQQWRELPVGGPAFRAAARVLASEPAWGTLLTPAIEELWLAAQPPGATPIRIQARGLQLLLTRDDGRALASADTCLPLLRLGAALLAACRTHVHGR